MGTLSTTKFVRNNAGSLAEQAALTTTAGASDAQRIPALNAAGVLDQSIVNAVTASAGAADSGKVVALDASGRISSTAMPSGIGADTALITTSEALAAGDYVNIFESTGAKVRKADATIAGKHAMGFVLTSAALGVFATVYFEGTNTAVTGQTPGDVYLQVTAGLGGATAPSASGNVVQAIGFATSPTTVNFQAQRPLVLA